MLSSRHASESMDVSLVQNRLLLGKRYVFTVPAVPRWYPSKLLLHRTGQCSMLNISLTLVHNVGLIEIYSNNLQANADSSDSEMSENELEMRRRLLLKQLEDSK